MRYFIFSLVFVFSFSTIHASDNDDFACLQDLTISQWDGMLALSGSLPCGYKDYDVLYSVTASGPFAKIGIHNTSTFYFVPSDGYYKLKVLCGTKCHESNVLHFDEGLSPVCEFTIEAPFTTGSTIKHCYSNDGNIHLDASSWISGCTVATYEWTTPSGIVSGKALHGNHGYGTYLLTVTCHDASCYYETANLWFVIKEHCYTTNYCHFDFDAPYQTKEHCYKDDGDLWINGASWVSNCGDATYKWTTPIGIVYGPLLEGNFGYGTYSLRVICNESDCHYVEENVSFVLKDRCEAHCHFKIDSPIGNHVKHCYDSEGIVWIDASSWVKGCHNVHYKWETPNGNVTGPILDGKYGYGQFTLKVTCHDAACYYESLSTSFHLVDDCHKPFVMHCPKDKWVDCDAELWNLDSFGKPYYYHNSKKVWVYGEKVNRHINDCNRGYITREWKMKDPYGYWHNCSQTIYVGEDVYGKVKIDWPTEHVELEGCNPSLDPDHLPYGAQKPHYGNTGCSKLGHSYTDKEFYYSGTCKKVVRKWTVIDWCVYDPNHSPDDGRHEYYQTIKISNTVKPIVSLEDKITVSTSNCDNVYVALDDLVIDASSCGDKFNISNNSPHAEKHRENASGTYPVGTTEVYYTVQYGCGYEKQYKQVITVKDDGQLTVYCGGKMVMPLRGIDTDGDGVNERGEAEIWAKDFNAGSSDNCGGDLDFSFSSDSLVMSRIFTCDELGINDVEIYISDARGNYTYCNVEIHIQNNGANISDCVRAEDETEEEETESQDADETEEDQTENESEEETGDEDENDDDSNITEDETTEDYEAKTSGLIKTQYGLPIAEVKIDLYMSVKEQIGEATFDIVETKTDSFYGGSGALIYVISMDTVWHEAEVAETMVMQTSTNTNNQGEYLFSNMAINESFMIEPTSEEMDTDKLDIADANRLYAHVSGVEPLTDPYALLAADVNQSGYIDLDDLDYLLAFINGENDELGDEEMIFIDATYQFADETNPWSEPYSTSRMIEASEVQNHRADFIAITLGDLVDDAEGSHEELIQTNLRTRQTPVAVVSPNPFNNYTTISINNSETQQAVLSLYTIDGQRVYQSEYRLAQGQEKLIITHDMIPQSGVYIYTLALNNSTLKGRLLKLQ